MKKLFTLSTFSLLLVFSTFTFAQTPPPEGINYQAVARDTSGNPISSSLNLVVKFTILSDTSTGTIIFTEIHSPVNTNRYGLFTLVIGSIETTDFQNLNWAAGDKFLQVEIATVGGSSYTSMGKTLMMSVPYALHSKTSGSATNNWGLQGNNLANPTDFIGTTNSQDLVVKTAGTEKLRVQSGGNVGIGTSNPSALFSVGSGSEFQVDSTGAIDTATGIISSGTIRFSGLSPNGIVRSSGGDGTLISSGPINLTSEVSDSLSVANGGTGLTSLGNWQAFYSDGIGAFTPFALGDSGKVFQSNGPASAPSWTAPSSLMQNLTNGTGISPFIYNGSTAAAVNIAPSGITAGTYTSIVSGQTITIPNFTVNAQGQITAVSSPPLTFNAEAPLTFNNGLTRTVNTIQLGGPLTQNTTITGGSFNMLFDLNSTGDFKINKNGNIPAFFVNPTTGYVGVGTGTPSSPLTIQSVAGTDIEFVATGATFSDISANSQLNIGSTTSSIHLKTSAATRLFVGTTGDIGIGTTAPGAKLDIAGTIKIVDGTEGAGKMLTSDAAGLASWTTPVSGSGTLNYIPKWTPNGTTLGNSRVFDNGTYIGIGTINPAAGLVISGSSLWSSAIGIENTTASMEWRIATTTTGMLNFVKVTGSTFTAISINPTSGNVGIGTTAPSAKLHSSTGIIGTGSAGTFDNYNVTNTSPAITVITNGIGSGIFATTTGLGNAGTFVISNPSSSLDALYAETNGTGSTVYGKNTSTGKAGSFEVFNSLSSANTLHAITNGTGNAIFAENTGTGIGRAGTFKTGSSSTADATIYAENNSAGHAIFGINKGTGRAGAFQVLNSASTADALYVTSNGSGSNAFSVLHTGTSNSGTNYGAYVKTNGTRGAGTTTNIGGYFTAVGAVNNYAAIFDQGNVGIGTATPTAKLEVAGQIKITGGTPGAGKVLTSDAVGLATWAAGTLPGWSLTGNTGITSPGVPITYGTTTIAASENWIGTTDDNDLVLGTNNKERMRIRKTSGFIGIGTASPNSPLTIQTRLGNELEFVSSGSNANIHSNAQLDINSTATLNLLTNGTIRLSVLNNGNVGIGTTTTATNARLAINDGHFQSLQTTGPTVSSTISFIQVSQILSNATDVAGNVSIIPVSNTVGSVTILFNKSYSSAPIVILSPTNVNAANDISKVWVTTTSTSFTINFIQTFDTSAHTFSYHVIETY